MSEEYLKNIANELSILNRLLIELLNSYRTKYTDNTKPYKYEDFEDVYGIKSKKSWSHL